MSLDTGAIITALDNHVSASGYFERVNGHEPKAAPSIRGITCAIWWRSTSPVPRGSGLNKTSARVEINVRLYTSMLTEPQDSIDPNLTNALDALMVAYSGDFSLGGSVRCIDLLGQTGVPLSAQSGYVEIDKKMYRIATILVPIIVNDVWTQTA